MKNMCPEELVIFATSLAFKIYNQTEDLDELNLLADVLSLIGQILDVMADKREIQAE